MTRWYRSPEILFGSDQYGPAVDMWSLGCIFAELMLKTPFFPGDNEMDQLSKIFTALGTPTEDLWPGMKTLPRYMEFQRFPPSNLQMLFTAATTDALDLLVKMLRYDPLTRISAAEALKHPYFQLDPQPTQKNMLPLPQKKITKRPLRPEVIGTSTALLAGVANINNPINNTKMQKVYQRLNFDNVVDDDNAISVGGKKRKREAEEKDEDGIHGSEF